MLRFRAGEIKVEGNDSGILSRREDTRAEYEAEEPKPLLWQRCS
jgi:hypothetical protein